MAIRTSPLQRVPGVFRHYRHLLPLMPLAARAWRIRDVDLVISLSHCVAKAVVPPPRRAPRLLLLHADALRLAGPRRLSRRLVRSADPQSRGSHCFLTVSGDWDRATARRVTHFVAISETIRERIAHCYDRDSRVIPPPVEPSFTRRRPTRPSREDFYLVVSALVPYKRIDQAVTACTRLGRRLVVIGEGPERARLEAMAGPTVTFLGWQPDDVIRDHYRRCRALLFPGEEDFGIVPIEALACGAP